MSLQKFRTFNADTITIEELVELSAFGRAYRDEWERLGEEVPEFVSGQLNSIQHEIRAKTADRNAARLKELDARIEGYSTASEKKAKAIKEREALLKKLKTA